MQRVAYHKGRLRADDVQRLEAPGFRWIGTEAFWERQFRRWQAATQRRRTRHFTPAGDKELARPGKARFCAARALDGWAMAGVRTRLHPPVPQPSRQCDAMS